MSKRKSGKVYTNNYNWKEVKARTPNQQLLIDTIEKNLITFVLGPAGTGKGHISIGCAIEHYYKQYVSNIIISRPLVEAAHYSMGAIPGTLEEKTKPYLIPLLDEIEYFCEGMPPINKPPIDIIPLNYMRGRTFKNSFICLDEAQNANFEQLKMFITRFGEGSKMVINGDITQSDLPLKNQGALKDFVLRLRGIDLIGVVEMQNEDIVRHSILSEVLKRLA